MQEFSKSFLSDLFEVFLPENFQGLLPRIPPSTLSGCLEVFQNFFQNSFNNCIRDSLHSHSNNLFLEFSRVNGIPKWNVGILSNYFCDSSANCLSCLTRISQKIPPAIFQTLHQFFLLEFIWSYSEDFTRDSFRDCY